MFTLTQIAGAYGFASATTLKCHLVESGAIKKLPRIKKNKRTVYVDELNIIVKFLGETKAIKTMIGNVS